MKTLSADSKTQAKKISNLVQSITKATNGTVETIKSMAENVETGKLSIEQSSKALMDISQSIKSISTISEGISVAAGDQKKSIDAVSVNLDKISGIAADTSTSSMQAVLSAEYQRIFPTPSKLSSVVVDFRRHA